VHSLGLYRYAERIAQLPVSAIIDVGANSLFPAYSRISGEPERFRRAYLHALGLLLVAAAAVAGLLIALGEPLVVVVLGEKWRGSGVALEALAGLSVGTAMCTSIEVIKGAGRTSLVYWLTGIEAVLGVGLVAWMGPVWGLVGIGLAVALTSIGVGGAAVAMSRSLLGMTWGSILRIVGPVTGAALVASAVVRVLEETALHASQQPLGVALLLLVAEGLLFVIIYGTVLRLLGPALFRTVRELVMAVVRKLRRRSAESQQPPVHR
jgi:PST family polysaccharide transporter